MQLNETSETDEKKISSVSNERMRKGSGKLKLCAV